MIDDSLPNDVYGATRAGLQAVLMDRKAEAREREFLRMVPTVLSLTDFTSLLTGERPNEAEQFVAER